MIPLILVQTFSHTEKKSLRLLIKGESCIPNNHIPEKGKSTMNKKYVFHWLDGKQDIGEGQDEADAFTKLGYGGGAVRALDWVERVYLMIIPKGDLK
jgi:hypothetical protein